MSRRRLLLLLKPFDVYPARQTKQVQVLAHSILVSHFLLKASQVLGYLDNTNKVHKDAIKFCQDILQRKSLDWEPVFRNNLSQPIRDVDLVITIGGDGTLLQANHYMDESIPVLGVNSDPTQVEEFSLLVLKIRFSLLPLVQVEQFSDEFDATRSTGYLCAATVRDFEQARLPHNISKKRENDNYSIKINRDSETCSPLVHCRSSGLRVSTSAGSTAAMLSA
ncbi:hypothetical protein HHK36_023465 [Tetracentron sinense]|uniref:NAD(+) kinase n=1 Tax=Tetracentron sinense TaxID=13715 RepID=A0A834YLG6_TETSI|nr:hypothetical protein HHK36_023465 [Tetracentron sinense]